MTSKIFKASTDITERLEFHDMISHKFWYLISNGSSGYTANWGRIGATPQTTDYSVEQARKKFNEKIAKGYQRVGSNLQQAATERMMARKKEDTNSGVDFLSGLAKVK